MKMYVLKIVLLLSALASADEELPVWEYPILGSEYIGDSCSLETNQVLMKISFSISGAIENIVFIKKSTIPEVNKEAEKYMMGESPFGEFEDMSVKEAKNFSTVIMSYTIPCQDT